MMFKWALAATLLSGATAIAVAPQGAQEGWQVSTALDGRFGQVTVDLTRAASDRTYGDKAPGLSIRCENDRSRVAIGGGGLHLGSESKVIVLWHTDSGHSGASKAVLAENTAVFNKAEAAEFARALQKGRSVTVRLIGDGASHDLRFAVHGLEDLLRKEAVVCKPLLS